MSCLSRVGINSRALPFGGPHRPSVLLYVGQPLAVRCEAKTARSPQKPAQRRRPARPSKSGLVACPGASRPGLKQRRAVVNEACVSQITVAKHPITGAADAWSHAVPSLVRRYLVGIHSRRTCESVQPPLVLGQIL